MHFLNFSSQKTPIDFVRRNDSRSCYRVNAVVSVVFGSLCRVFSFTSSMACQRYSILCAFKELYSHLHVYLQLLPA